MPRDWRELDEDELRELEEAEDEIPRGWRPSLETIQAIEGEESREMEELAEGLQRLEATDIGQPIVEAIREHGTVITFESMEQDVIAKFDPEANKISVNEGLKNASPNVLAAHLAHEGTHVQWDQPDSIDQEYHAFKAQAGVWDQLKGDETDKQCDWVSQMIAKGEAEAKAEIRQLYPELPEH